MLSIEVFSKNIFIEKFVTTIIFLEIHATNLYIILWKIKWDELFNQETWHSCTLHWFAENLSHRGSHWLLTKNCYAVIHRLKVSLAERVPKSFSFEDGNNTIIHELYWCKIISLLTYFCKVVCWGNKCHMIHGLSRFKINIIFTFITSHSILSLMWFND